MDLSTKAILLASPASRGMGQALLQSIPSQSSYRHATLKAAPRSHSKPLTAFSAKQPHSSWQLHDYNSTDWDRQSATGSEVPPGMVKLSLKEESTHEWINDVKFALKHKHRMKAPCEVKDDEHPTISRAVDQEQLQEGIDMSRPMINRFLIG